MTRSTPSHSSFWNRPMNKTPIFAALFSLLLISACSHPVAELAYPDGSVRTPINAQPPQKAPGPQKYGTPPADRS